MWVGQIQEQMSNGALASTAWTHQCECLPWLPGEVDVWQDLEGLRALRVHHPEGDRSGHARIVQEPVAAALKLPAHGHEHAEELQPGALCVGMGERPQVYSASVPATSRPGDQAPEGLRPKADCP